MNNLVDYTKQTEQWGIFELTLAGPSEGNPFTDINLGAQFNYKNRTIHAQGFYDGEGIYKIRFMPDAEGTWSFETKSNLSSLDGLTGRFESTSPSANNHGPVRVKNTYHFAYEDGTPHISVGTTCYAWTHQPSELQEKTLETLESSPFNKLRMCVFPKFYDYNKKEPLLYPFEENDSGEWDYTRYNTECFRHFENRVRDLMHIGVEADIILFHPYDRWGFSDMGRENDDRYLRYITARLGAYRNVWWSLANEFDLMHHKKTEDWERFAKIIMESDPYQHLRSIHNCSEFYDYTKPWITHCSMQRIDVYKTSENTDLWRSHYHKPIVIDECAYEGNVTHGWGSITGEEMTRRFWEGAVRGGYMGHGETYVHPDDILWWSHGSELHGTSPARIAFLKQILEKGPSQGISPISYEWDVACGGVPGEYYLIYFGFNQPAFRKIRLPDTGKFHIDILNTWDMTITPVEGLHEKSVHVQLPGKPYMAVRIIKSLDC